MYGVNVFSILKTSILPINAKECFQDLMYLYLVYTLEFDLMYLYLISEEILLNKGTIMFVCDLYWNNRVKYSSIELPFVPYVGMIIYLGIEGHFSITQVIWNYGHDCKPFDSTK